MINKTISTKEATDKAIEKDLPYIDALRTFEGQLESKLAYYYWEVLENADEPEHAAFNAGEVLKELTIAMDDII